ncbi:SDR family oxidoreductase [Microbulbifer sp. 2205BS26-8]|uniref:SDR family oxidoreductase n=1 Tax=Microbulbifer sp. 2205BS26-8 TaxID=3064386 RepID=UPI00273F2B64|nr:SDR family oxidoreductase [Microbulbifer sp. 2205BS26-8]MDP5209555.1 SDR family oxidoreductase [Microbulbifer sp. 2205BS26-8]
MSVKDSPAYVQGHHLLTGKSVLITAAAGAGIGFAAATRAVEENCRGLTISDVHEGRLYKAVEQLSNSHPDTPVFGQLCDVTSEDDVQLLIKIAEEQHSGVDVLINNAGLGGTCKLVAMPDKQWSRVLDITLTGTMRMMRAILPLMQARKRGVIINNASVLGWRAQREQTHYAAAKAGVMALTRCAAMEAADYQVRINAVSPSIALHEFLKKTTPVELLEELVRKEAFGRAAEVWEVANVMMFLASDYSSYMTGEIVSVSSQRA